MLRAGYSSARAPVYGSRQDIRAIRCQLWVHTVHGWLPWGVLPEVIATERPHSVSKLRQVSETMHVGKRRAIVRATHHDYSDGE